MLTVVLMHHMGLTSAIADVISKIMGCAKCVTYWSCMVVLYAYGCSIFIAIVISAVLAYTALWCGPILERLNDIHNELWKRNRERRKARRRP